MNQKITKIAIIHGENPVDNVNKNGKIDYLKCTIQDEYFHIVLMLEYLKKNYKDNDILQNYNIYTNINTIALYLTKLGNIIFLNTTNYRKDILAKHGRHGVIMMPEYINEQQKDALNILKEYIKDYNELQIWYNITDDNQAEMLIGDIDIIDQFIKEKTR